MISPEVKEDFRVVLNVKPEILGKIAELVNTSEGIALESLNRTTDYFPDNLKGLINNKSASEIEEDEALLILKEHLQRLKREIEAISDMIRTTMQKIGALEEP